MSFREACFANFKQLGGEKSVNVNRRPHVSSFTSKHKSWHDDGKFDARLTARAIDHSHVDQTSLRTIDEQSQRRIVANRLSRYAGVRYVGPRARGKRRINLDVN